MCLFARRRVLLWVAFVAFPAQQLAKHWHFPHNKLAKHWQVQVTCRVNLQLPVKQTACSPTPFLRFPPNPALAATGTIKGRNTACLASLVTQKLKRSS